MLPYAIGARADARAGRDVRSFGDLGERGGWLKRARGFGDEFVVAAARVWMNVSTQAPIIGAAAGRIQPRRLWGEARGSMSSMDETGPGRISDEDLPRSSVRELKFHSVSITLCDYDPDWPELFACEDDRIRAVLGATALQVEHVGSTSVPGLIAKPIIDILLVVPDSADEASYLPALQEAGYVLTMREPDWFEHRLFNGPDTDINLHVFTVGAVEIDRMPRFRDWLRNHDADRAYYAETKSELAGRTWRHFQDYAESKTAVIAEIVDRASVV